ncbi:3537_t:CDS:2, partial [Acaulospora colombiana]
MALTMHKGLLSTRLYRGEYFIPIHVTSSSLKPFYQTLVQIDKLVRSLQSSAIELLDIQSGSSRLASCFLMLHCLSENGIHHLTCFWAIFCQPFTPVSLTERRGFLEDGCLGVLSLLVVLASSFLLVAAESPLQLFPKIADDIPSIDSFSQGFTDITAQYFRTTWTRDLNATETIVPFDDGGGDVLSDEGSEKSTGLLERQTRCVNPGYVPVSQAIAPVPIIIVVLRVYILVPTELHAVVMGMGTLVVLATEVHVPGIPAVGVVAARTGVVHALREELVVEARGVHLQVDRVAVLGHAAVEKLVVTGKAAHMRGTRAVEPNNASQDTSAVMGEVVHLLMECAVATVLVVPGRRAVM